MPRVSSAVHCVLMQLLVAPRPQGMGAVQALHKVFAAPFTELSLWHTACTRPWTSLPCLANLADSMIAQNDSGSYNIEMLHAVRHVGEL